MRTRTLLAAAIPALAIGILATTSPSAAGGPPLTEFSYQGRLADGGTPVDGSVDLRFRLYDDELAGAQLGSEVERLGVAVAGGVFTVEIDFGAMFDGTGRWLEIDVRHAGDPGYTPLSPRQRVAPAPMALFALDAPSSGPFFYSGANATFAGGNVGIGTGAPMRALDVRPDGLAIDPGSIAATSDLVVGSVDAMVDLVSDGSGQNGSQLNFKQVDGSGNLVDNWGIFRKTTGSGSSLQLAYGTDPDNFGNATKLTLNTNSTISIPFNTRFGYGNTLDVSYQGQPITAHGLGWHNDAWENQGGTLWMGGFSGIKFMTDFAAPRLSITRPGLVGIGTTSPEQKMHVSGSGNVYTLVESADAEAGVEFLSDATGPVYVYSPNGTDDLRLYVDGGDRMSITTGGNVGIGTSAPVAQLQIVSDATPGTPFNTLRLEAPNLGNRVSHIHNGANGDWYIRSASSAGNVLLQDNGGKVGIGTAAPTQLLDVNGTAIVDVLQIRGGADLVEGFETSDDDVLEPGTVVVIDPANPGALMRSVEAYDAKVAGVVSGAGGVEPGIHLGQHGVMDGDVKVAMTGRVYVRCSAENGAIRPGDRLTTAALAGCAMKATDADRSDGAVIGKAMSALDEGTGLVLVLVNLQ